MENNKKIKIEDMNSIKTRVDGWVTIEDALLNCPIGSKVFLKNKDVVIKYCYNMFIDKKHTRACIGELLDEVEEIQIPEYTRVVKSKVEVLDKVEKEYLNAVIAPFRSKVIFIKKRVDIHDYEYLGIKIDENWFEHTMNFPNFKAGTMYKGMELNKEYTLEELGLKGE